MYRQLLSCATDLRNCALCVQIVAAASTTEKMLRVNLTNHRNKDAAASVGRAVAQRSIAAGISAVHFNRPKGNRFHGKLRMLIDNMRDAGLPLH